MAAKRNAVKRDATHKINQFICKLVEGAVALTKYRHLLCSIYIRSQLLSSLRELEKQREISISGANLSCLKVDTQNRSKESLPERMISPDTGIHIVDI